MDQRILTTGNSVTITEAAQPAFPHISRSLHEAPWAILPAKLNEIVAFLNVRLNGGTFSADHIAGVRQAARSSYQTSNAIAVIPIFGTITPRATGFSEMSGGTSVQGIRKALNEALNDDAVGTILLEVDSPGGIVDGVPELADEIRAARGTKPIIAHANTMAASAAYWLAAQADELIVTPSGEVGSIGVLMSHVNQGPFTEAMGLEVTYIYTPKYKVEGNPYESLSDDTRDYLQGTIDEFYSMFTSAVAKGRGTTPAAVRKDFGEGRMVMARQAKTLGMVDRVESFPDTLARLSGTRKRSRRADEMTPVRTSANVDRRRRELWLRSAVRKES